MEKDYTKPLQPWIKYHQYGSIDCPSSSSSSIASFPYFLEPTLSVSSFSTLYSDSDVSTIQTEYVNKQELKRSFSTFSSFSLAFSNIGVLANLSATFQTVLSRGGPVIVLLGWNTVAILMACMALSFAELCSIYPVGGGLRLMVYEMLKTRPKTNAQFIARFAGCTQAIGNIISIGATNISIALSFGSLLNIVFGQEISRTGILFITLCILVIHLISNYYFTDALTRLNRLNVFWSGACLLLVIFLLSFCSKQHQDPLWVFTHFENRTGFDSPYYVFVLALAGATNSILGSECSLVMIEETEDDSIAAPTAIVTSITTSWIFGCIYLIVLLFSIHDVEALLTTRYNLPVAQIFMVAFGTPLTIGFLLVMIFCQFCSGSAIFTVCSRQIYYLAKNGVTPYRQQLQQLNEYGVPGRASVATFVLACCVILPYPLSDRLFTIIVSAAPVAVFTTFSIALGCKLFVGTGAKKGRFSLGQFSKPVNTVGFIWTVCAVVAFALPTEWPVTLHNANYAGPALCVVVCVSYCMVSRACSQS